jgi:hypothetical protein
LEAINTLRRLRREARVEVARLIAFLDQSDTYVMTELEDDEDLEEVGGDEPSPGAFDRMIDQSKSWRLRLWDIHAEPALGSLEQHDNQEQWAAGGRRDLELDQSDSGIADLDRLLEQVGSQDWQHGGQG